MDTLNKMIVRDHGAAMLLLPHATTDILFVFSLTASPETAPLPSCGLRGLRSVFPTTNEHGSGSYGDYARGALVFALRGRVTLDSKVRHAHEAGAAALIILDVTGDAIGPDLDELAPIVVGCVARADVEAVISLLRAGG